MIDCDLLIIMIAFFEYSKRFIKLTILIKMWPYTFITEGYFISCTYNLEEIIFLFWLKSLFAQNSNILKL